MKVLLVHNHYGSSAPSGENLVFEREKELLTRRGNQVEVLERFSDSIRARGLVGASQGAISLLVGRSAKQDIAKLVRRFRPEVVHAHNTFPLISNSIFHACQESARVLTLHNYRLFCANAMLSRNGGLCTRCIDERFSLPAVVHGCYRGSRFASLPLALSIERHRYAGTWKAEVDVFIALSEYQRGIMVRGGLPADRVEVKANFVGDSSTGVDWRERSNSALFVGRLCKEKGVLTLVRAWINWGALAPNLVLVGDGPLRAELERIVYESGNRNIQFLGHLDPGRVRRLMGSVKLVVVASEVPETFGLVACEALSAGTPVLGSGLGAIQGVVGEEAGEFFEAGSDDSLLRVARRMFASDEKLEMKSIAAKSRFLNLYSEEASHSALVKVYELAIERRKRVEY